MKDTVRRGSSRFRKGNKNEEETGGNLLNCPNLKRRSTEKRRDTTRPYREGKNDRISIGGTTLSVRRKRCFSTTGGEGGVRVGPEEKKKGRLAFLSIRRRREGNSQSLWGKKGEGMTSIQRRKRRRKRRKETGNTKALTLLRENRPKFSREGSFDNLKDLSAAKHSGERLGRGGMHSQNRRASLSSWKVELAR